MSRNHLAYWKPITADQNLKQGGLHDFAFSAQFGRVAIGDDVWIVTSRSGRLSLLGKIEVGEVTDFDGAVNSLPEIEGVRFEPNELFILAKEGTASAIREIPITHLAGKLRFVSKADRLNVNDGLVNPGQLQTMRILTPESAELLRDTLDEYVRPEAATMIPEEIEQPSTVFEGAKCRIWVNAYERNKEARRRCIAHYGTRCRVCECDIGERYGDEIRGLIHVHHLRPLSEISALYEVDPVADLVPVCPNCHAVIHMRKPPYSIDEVKAMFDR